MIGLYFLEIIVCVSEKDEVSRRFYIRDLEEVIEDSGGFWGEDL